MLGVHGFYVLFKLKFPCELIFAALSFAKFGFLPLKYSIQDKGSFNNHVMYTTKWLGGPTLSVRSFDCTDTARPPRLSITRICFLEKSLGTELDQRIQPIKFVICATWIT